MMRYIGPLLAGVVATLAAGVILITFADNIAAPDGSALLPASTATPGPLATPAPLRGAWGDELSPRQATSAPVLLVCLDANDDGRLNSADGSPLFRALDVVIHEGESCADSRHGADFFEDPQPGSLVCVGGARPVFAIVIAGGGSDLLDATEGDSQGLLTIMNAVTARAAEAGVSLFVTISSGAVVGADMAQTSLERLLTDYIAVRLEALPCARALLIGHSHGGVTVSSVTAALDDRFADRMLGVLVDRSNALYDRPAEDMPSLTPLLNVFQTNEGWHGVRLDAPNVINRDESSKTAPIAPADGGGGPARVTHRSLDDSPAVQSHIFDVIRYWMTAQP